MWTHYRKMLEPNQLKFDWNQEYAHAQLEINILSGTCIQYSQCQLLWHLTAVHFTLNMFKYSLEECPHSLEHSVAWTWPLVAMFTSKTHKDYHNRERTHGMSEPLGMLIRCSVTNWQLIITRPVGSDEGKEPRALSRGGDPRNWLVRACIGRASCRYVVRQAGCVYLNAGIRVIVGRGRALHQRQLPAGPRDRNIHQAQSAERGRDRRRYKRWTSHCSRDRGRHAPDKTLV